MNMKLVFFLMCLSFTSKQTLSGLTGLPGHYPAYLCKVNNAVFIPEEKMFYHDGENSDEKMCELNFDVWPVKHVEDIDDIKEGTQCDVVYKHGQAFTIFYWMGSSNYYHLTYDMLIPLYVQLYHKDIIKHEAHQIVFMPTVESRRLQILDWETIAFDNMSKYWADMSKFIADDSVFMPLDKTFHEDQEKICFEEIYFGTGKTDFSSPHVIKGFVEYVKTRLGIRDKGPLPHRLALVSRKGRRRILNENELLEALQLVIPSDLLEFSEMSFQQQILSVQNYTVFAAVNGAGLMNALYLPKHSVAIQIAPYKSGLNIKQYGLLIKAKGPYLEWENTHEELTETFKEDPYNNRPNTIVHIEEFTEKVQEAMQLYDQEVLKDKDEL